MLLLNDRQRSRGDIYVAPVRYGLSLVLRKLDMTRSARLCVTDIEACIMPIVILG